MLPVFKPVLTSKIFWQLSHDDGFGVTKLCIILLRKHIPKKPLDSTVLPVNNYLSKVRKKKTTTKAFVQHFNHFKQINSGWKIMFKIMPFLAPQRTLGITSVVGCKGDGEGWGGGGWGWGCRISAGSVHDQENMRWTKASQKCFKWLNNLKFVQNVHWVLLNQKIYSKIYLYQYSYHIYHDNKMWKSTIFGGLTLIPSTQWL